MFHLYSYTYEPHFNKPAIHNIIIFSNGSLSPQISTCCVCVKEREAILLWLHFQQLCSQNMATKKKYIVTVDHVYLTLKQNLATLIRVSGIKSNKTL